MDRSSHYIIIINLFMHFQHCQCEIMFQNTVQNSIFWWRFSFTGSPWTRRKSVSGVSMSRDRDLATRIKSTAVAYATSLLTSSLFCHLFSLNWDTRRQHGQQRQREGSHGFDGRGWKEIEVITVFFWCTFRVSGTTVAALAKGPTKRKR